MPDLARILFNLYQYLPRLYLPLQGPACYLLKFSAMIRSYQGMSPRIHASCYVDESAQIIGDVEIGENSSVWMNVIFTRSKSCTPFPSGAMPGRTGSW